MGGEQKTSWVAPLRHNCLVFYGIIKIRTPHQRGCAVNSYQPQGLSAISPSENHRELWGPWEARTGGPWVTECSSLGSARKEKFKTVPFLHGTNQKCFPHGSQWEDTRGSSQFWDCWAPSWFPHRAPRLLFCNISWATVCAHSLWHNVPCVMNQPCLWLQG